jgi:hypothetical protein
MAYPKSRPIQELMDKYSRLKKLVDSGKSLTAAQAEVGLTKSRYFRVRHYLLSNGDAIVTTPRIPQINHKKIQSFPLSTPIAKPEGVMNISGDGIQIARFLKELSKNG